MQERSILLKELDEKTLPITHISNSDSQTDDDQHEELLQTNKRLDRVLQTFQEKIDQMVTNRPDLFDDTSKEINERLDRLISTIENQATQLNQLQTERSRIEEELQT